ncbi:uncharacterized protein LOC126278919 [Schistocerca gregaria]|uniref:uncharacterized protein LOC126278919 n=1 Tax=Schistocerca gregaria TaxID=7010 RepID=UPI00211F0400|nr:uncharacterized protein LOC126278919 [Schistocerca gregaria]
MLEWLQNRRVACNESMRKQVLFALMQEHRPAKKTYVIDEMAKEKGHMVVRLPPYNCDLRAVELAWAKLKRLIRERDISGDVSKVNLFATESESLLSVTADDWEEYCRKVQQLEEEYWRRDGVVKLAIDDVIINTTETDSSDEHEAHT